MGWAMSSPEHYSLCPLPSPTHHKPGWHQRLGKRYFLKKELRSIFQLTNGIYSELLVLNAVIEGKVQGQVHAGLGPGVQIRPGSRGPQLACRKQHCGLCLQAGTQGPKCVSFLHPSPGNTCPSAASVGGPALSQSTPSSSSSSSSSPRLPLSSTPSTCTTSPVPSRSCRCRLCSGQARGPQGGEGRNQARMEWGAHRDTALGPMHHGRGGGGSGVNGGVEFSSFSQE